MPQTILLSGATGFVGSHLYPALAGRDDVVICGSRSPTKAKRRHPDRAWVELDLHRPDLEAK